MAGDDETVYFRNHIHFMFTSSCSPTSNPDMFLFLQNASQPTNADAGSHQRLLAAFPVQHGHLPINVSPLTVQTSLCYVMLFLTSSSCATYRYTLEQQILAPSFPMQQVNCNAVLVPSPVFTSPIMIPHNSFITHQSQSAYHSQPQTSQHSLQLQQPQQFFQVHCSNMSQHVVLSLLHRFLD